jgi:hypothetical protein
MRPKHRNHPPVGAILAAAIQNGKDTAIVL